MNFDVGKNMKYLYIILTLLLIGISYASEDEVNDPFGSDAQPEPAAKISEFPEWTFCIAYNFRDADKRDSRPNPFKESSEDDYIHPGSLIIPTYMLDTAGLVSRTISQKKINKDSAQRLFNLSLKANKNDRKYPALDCYDPHHIIIFYHDWGIPVGCIEVCFTCNELKAYFREDGIMKWSR